jgi:hypothetical protein
VLIEVAKRYGVGPRMPRNNEQAVLPRTRAHYWTFTAADFNCIFVADGNWAPKQCGPLVTMTQLQSTWSPTGKRNVLDFESAKLCWRTQCGSVGRWRIVASAQCLDNGARDRAGERFVVTAVVMAGDVYGKGRLPLSPAYSFRMMAGPDDHVIWRDYADADRDTTEAHAAQFERVEISAPQVQMQRADISAIATGMQAWPLVGVITTGDRNSRIWSLEFPIVHINHRRDAGATEFQVETGPILVPEDLVPPGDAVTAGGFTGGFTLAYAFFNRLDRVDLAVLRRADPGPAIRRTYSGFARLDGVEIAILA